MYIKSKEQYLSCCSYCGIQGICYIYKDENNKFAPGDHFCSDRCMEEYQKEFHN